MTAAGALSVSVMTLTAAKAGLVFLCKLCTGLRPRGWKCGAGKLRTGSLPMLVGKNAAPVTHALPTARGVAGKAKATRGAVNSW